MKVDRYFWIALGKVVGYLVGGSIFLIGLVDVGQRLVRMVSYDQWVRVAPLVLLTVFVGLGIELVWFLIVVADAMADHLRPNADAETRDMESSCNDYIEKLDMHYF